VSAADVTPALPDAPSAHFDLLAIGGGPAGQKAANAVNPTTSPTTPIHHFHCQIRATARTGAVVPAMRVSLWKLSEFSQRPNRCLFRAQRLHRIQARGTPSRENAGKQAEAAAEIGRAYSNRPKPW